MAIAAEVGQQLTLKLVCGPGRETKSENTTSELLDMAGIWLDCSAEAEIVVDAGGWGRKPQIVPRIATSVRLGDVVHLLPQILVFDTRTFDASVLSRHTPGQRP